MTRWQARSSPVPVGALVHCAATPGAPGLRPSGKTRWAPRRWGTPRSVDRGLLDSGPLKPSREGCCGLPVRSEPPVSNFLAMTALGCTLPETVDQKILGAYGWGGGPSGSGGGLAGATITAVPGATAGVTATGLMRIS